MSVTQHPFAVGDRIVYFEHVGIISGYKGLSSGVTTYQYTVRWDDNAEGLHPQDLREWFDHNELTLLSTVQTGSEVETSWSSLRLEPGFQQLVNSVASSLRVAYYHGDPEATLDSSENKESWLRMAEAAVKEIWFA